MLSIKQANLTTAILLASGTLMLAACDNSGDIEALQEQIDDARAELDEQPQGATPDSAPAADAATENVPPAVPTASPPAAEAPTVLNAQGYPLKTDARGHELVLIPPGTFTMGATLHEREVPPHQVTLTREYWLDVYEVTNAQYTTCVGEGACIPPSDSSSNSRPSYYGDAAFASFPVIWVSWQDASTFCEWREGRLPSEAEWEYAARGAAGADYPWGNSPPTCSLTNFSLKEGENACTGDTTLVGSYPAGTSPFGVYDMAGNVWEWVADFYAVYPGTSLTDPIGPPTGTDYVERGGSWANDDLRVRGAYRFLGSPTNANFALGFRCAFDS